MFSIVTENPEVTKQLGKNLGRSLFAGSIVALTGELGSGKTTLVQGIGQGLGIKSSIKSPSFVIINEYDGPLPLYHFDLYRLDNAQEILCLGYQEYFYEKRGVVVIEWAKKIKDLLPKEYLKIDLEIVNLSKRKISGQAYGAPYREVIRKMERLFCSC
jgi:tRNA threonylcarbamoyladenosine biosynthesis protein TsaE